MEFLLEVIEISNKVLRLKNENGVLKHKMTKLRENRHSTPETTITVSGVEILVDVEVAIGALSCAIKDKEDTIEFYMKKLEDLGIYRPNHMVEEYTKE